MNGAERRRPLPRRLRRGELVALAALAAAAYLLVLVEWPGMAGLFIVACTALGITVRRLWPVPVFGVVLVLSIVGGYLGMTAPWSGRLATRTAD